MSSVLSINSKPGAGSETGAFPKPSAGNHSTSKEETAVAEKELKDIRFGREMRKEFPFEASWTNMNNGSFGSIPTHILHRLHHYSHQSELRPDQFIRYDYPVQLRESRKAVAGIVNAPVNTIVLLSNATDAVNTVLRNFKWNEDGKDVVIMFDTVYEGCGKAVDFLTDYFADDKNVNVDGALTGQKGRVSSVEIPLSYPEVEDDEIVAKFRAKVQEVQAAGKRARLALFDVVSSRPGVCFPWVRLVAVCKELNVFSLVDGAQGVGMVPLDLPQADPDVFLSNCHKWLHVPRGCALLYVPVRNQHLVPSTLATSHGYISKHKTRTSPLPPKTETPFEINFGFVGTIDNSPYLCVKDAVQWRKDIGGEKKITDYLWSLNKKGGQLVADKLGTFVMDNKAGTLTNCAMCNVALPIWVGEKGKGAKEEDVVLPSGKDAEQAFQWMLTTMNSDYNTFIAMYAYSGRLWTRLSAQVYLEEKDYEFAADTLLALGERVRKGEYKT